MQPSRHDRDVNVKPSAQPRFSGQTARPAQRTKQLTPATHAQACGGGPKGRPGRRC